MTSPVECVNTIETVGRLRKIAEDSSTHHAFPVVEDYDPYSVRQPVTVVINTLCFSSLTHSQGLLKLCIKCWQTVTLPFSIELEDQHKECMLHSINKVYISCPLGKSNIYVMDTKTLNWHLVLLLLKSVGTKRPWSTAVPLKNNYSVSLIFQCQESHAHERATITHL